MRRIVSYILIGLGVFAVALGLLLRFYAYPKLAKVPLDIDNTSVAQGNGVTALVIDEVDGVPSPEIRENLSLTSTTHVTGDLTQPEIEEDGDVAAWVEATKTVDDASGILVDASLRELCLDRHTGESVAPCEGQYISVVEGERITADPNTVQQPGLNFKFPFDTEKRSYDYYDLTLRHTVEARFDGEDSIKGVDTYRFVTKTEPTKVDIQEVPGSLIGMDDQPSVSVDRYYENQRTLWVEPTTGALLAVEDKGKQELVGPGQSPGSGTTVYEGTLRLNDKTVSANVEEAESNTGRLALLTVWPIVLWIAGGVLTVVGVVMLLVSNRSARRTG
jgi:Porin PorA